MKAPIPNPADLDSRPFPGGFPEPARAHVGGARIGLSGRAPGATALGCNAPGKGAFPPRGHRVDGERLFVPEGGIRLGDATPSIRAGGFVARPPDGPGAAHPIVDGGTTGLRCPTVGAREPPGIRSYPEPGRSGLAAGFGLGAPDRPGRLRRKARPGASPDRRDDE